MNKDEKRIINNILKLIFEKSQESIGYQKLEERIKNKTKDLNHKEKEEVFQNYFHLIKTEIFDAKSPYKQQIFHGDMKIFYSLFYIFKSSGLNIDNNLFLSIIEPLFEFFQKKDTKLVRYSVNTIIKILKGNKFFILKYFNNIFDKLIILILRKEIEVRNCGYFLDEIMKNDIGSIFQEDYSDNEEKIKSSFTLIIDYLIKRLEENNNYPAKNILIISWFNFFENIPKINLTNNYIQIIPKLLKMLSSKTKEENQTSELCLKKIINNIDLLYEDLCNEDSKNITKIIEIIIESCDGNEPNEQIKKCCFELLEVFLTKFKSIISKYNDLGEGLDKIEENMSPSHYNNINIDSSFYNEDSEEDKNMNDKNKKIENKNDLDNCNNYNNSEKKIINYRIKINKNYIEDMVINKDQDKIKSLMNNLPFKFFPNILEVIIHNITNISSKIPVFEPISSCNNIFKDLMNIIQPEYYKQKTEQKSFYSFERIIKKYLQSSLNEQSNINLIFDWVSQLYKRHFFNDEDYLIHIFSIIPEINETIIKRILDILNEICVKKNNSKFSSDIIKIIIHKLNDSPEMISTYGILIIKELIRSIDVEDLFEEIANNLLNQNDIYFVMRMINMLNKFLIQEDEANSIRNILSKFGNEGKNPKYFEKLYTLWSFNPFCTLILVLISNSFELGYFLIMYLSQMKFKTEDYIELSQVVQVFESSIFNHVRIKLLKPQKYSYLIKTLYAVLLLLPQGQAFEALSSRLKCLQIIYNLDDKDEGEEEDEEEDISCLKNFESPNQKIKLNFSEDSSNSLSSNFELSTKSVNNNQKEYSKFYPYDNKNSSIFKKNKYLDKFEDELFEKKGLIKYINIFKKIQNRKLQFEKNISESGRVRGMCLSPSITVNQK